MSRERTTTYVNLDDDDEESQIQIDRVMRVLHKRKKIVVVAGAGISVTAGIPDFRSEKGLFASLKSEFKLKGSGKDLFDADVYRDADSAAMFHKMVSSMSETIQRAKPTPFHHMLATLAHENRLLRLYSQNVDELETGMEPLRTTVPLSKLDNGQWPKTVQLHGGLAKMECSKCKRLLDFDRALFEGPVPPACDECLRINTLRTEVEGRRSHGVGYFRPRMVLYGEANPDGVAIGSVANKDMRQRPDAIIVVGTTLKVPGVRRIVQEMCEIVRDHRDGVAIWLNKDPPPTGQQLKDKWDIVVAGEADEIARRAALPRWDELSELDYQLPPTEKHYNNSFRAPADDTAPLLLAERGPTGSPLTIRKAGIKIENGLMTPTKPPKAAAPLIAVPRLGTKLTAAKKQIKKSKKKATPMPIQPMYNVSKMAVSSLINKENDEPRTPGKKHTPKKVSPSKVSFPNLTPKKTLTFQ